MKHKIAAVLGTTVLAAALSVVGGSPAFAAPVASFRSTVDGRRSTTTQTDQVIDPGLQY